MNTTLYEFFTRLRDWHWATFGKTTDNLRDRLYDKFYEEREEFYGTNDGSLEESQELIDVILVSLAIILRNGHDPALLLQEKLAILESPDRNQLERDRERGIA
jgi:hypothetical protein